MSARRLIGAIAALVLLIPLGAFAQPPENRGGNGGQPVYQVSGGGQVIASANAQGPGDTIAFVAQLTDSGDARGQLQVIDRTSGQGRDQTILHGRVTCVVPGEGNTARFGGEARDPRPGGEEIEFVVDVTDHDEQGNDVVIFREAEYEDDSDPESPCDADDDAEGQLRDVKLARGNGKIHDRR
jgi:hypothetical protein